MKRLFLFVSVAIVTVLVLGAFTAAPAQSAGAEGKARVMVQFQPGHRSAVERALKNAGAEFHFAFDELNVFVVTIPAAALDGIQRNPNVVLVEDDVMRFPISIMDSAEAVSLPQQVVPYGIDMVQARDVWDTNRDDVVDTGAVTASNRKICIIDSGFYTLHEDLHGVDVDGYDGNLPWDQDGKLPS